MADHRVRIVRCGHEMTRKSGGEAFPCSWIRSMSKCPDPTCLVNALMEETSDQRVMAALERLEEGIAKMERFPTEEPLDKETLRRLKIIVDAMLDPTGVDEPPAENNCEGCTYTRETCPASQDTLADGYCSEKRTEPPTEEE